MPPHNQKTMLKILQLKLLTLQLLALVFFTHAIILMRIIVSWNKYLWAWKPEPWSENESKAEFMAEIISWKFYSLLIGLTIIAFINWKRKVNYINTITIFIVSVSLFYMNFFQNRIFQFIFKPREISNNSYSNFLIYAVICFVLAMLLLLPLKRNGTTHNSGLL